jgi:phosphate uptake regulator
MSKVQFNGKQYTITISPEHIKRMGWHKGTEVYVAKDPDRDLLYIEKMSGKQRRPKSPEVENGSSA